MDKRKLIIIAALCGTFLTAEQTETFADTSDPVYIAKAAGLIDIYSLSCTAAGDCLTFSASTSGSEKMAEIGIRSIVLEKSSDGVTWLPDRNVADILKSGTAVLSHSQTIVGLESGIYYRVKAEHFAKENTKFFPREQKVVNTSKAVLIPEYNSVSVSMETLAEELNFDDFAIPAGAVAYTVNIAKNCGFLAYELLLDIGADAELITYSNGSPVITKGAAAGYRFEVAAAFNDGKLSAAFVSYDECTKDGGSFTFFAAPTSPEIDAKIIESSFYTHAVDYDFDLDFMVQGTPLRRLGEVYSSPVRQSSDGYISGDVNGDRIVDIRDAFEAFYVLSASGRSELVYKWINGESVENIYFPNAADRRAMELWEPSDPADEERVVMNNDTVAEMLRYCSEIAVSIDFKSNSYLNLTFK